MSLKYQGKMWTNKYTIMPGSYINVTGMQQKEQQEAKGKQQLHPPSNLHSQIYTNQCMQPPATIFSGQPMQPLDVPLLILWCSSWGNAARI